MIYQLKRVDTLSENVYFYNSSTKYKDYPLLC